MCRRIDLALCPLFLAASPVNQNHAGGVGGSLTRVELTVHVYHALHVVVVVQVGEECLLTLDAAIRRILHVTTDDDCGLAVVLHHRERIEGNLLCQSADFLTVVLLGRGTSKWRVGNDGIILLITLKRLCGILICNLFEVLPS